MYCSKSYVLRWANIIRDHCSAPLGIVLSKKDETEFDYRSATSTSFRENPKYEDEDDDDDDDRFTDVMSSPFTVHSFSVVFYFIDLTVVL